MPSGYMPSEYVKWICHSNDLRTELIGSKLIVSKLIGSRNFIDIY